jgi:hypothetical protein
MSACCELRSARYQLNVGWFGSHCGSFKVLNLVRGFFCDIRSALSIICGCFAYDVHS